MQIDSDYVAAVLDVVAATPPGRVITYAGVAAIVGRGGPRQVGRVMRLRGDDVPWWRVVKADGTPSGCHDGVAGERLLAEGTPMLRNGRVDPDAMVRAGAVTDTATMTPLQTHLTTQRR